PAAMHRAADGQDTPGRMSIWPLRRTCQLRPSHCSARLSKPGSPTAMQPSAAGQDTLLSQSSNGNGNGSGAAISRQAFPSHCSVRTVCREAPSYRRTAMQSVALLQEAPSRLLSGAPAGTAAAWSVQLCPSHRSMRAVKSAPEAPTAMQLLALAHEIPVSKSLKESGDGVASTRQLVPSHASASVKSGLPGELDS